MNAVNIPNQCSIDMILLDIGNTHSLVSLLQVQFFGDEPNPWLTEQETSNILQVVLNELERIRSKLEVLEQTLETEKPT